MKVTTINTGIYSTTTRRIDPVEDKPEAKEAYQAMAQSWDLGYVLKSWLDALVERYESFGGVFTYPAFPNNEEYPRSQWVHCNFGASPRTLKPIEKDPQVNRAYFDRIENCIGRLLELHRVTEAGQFQQGTVVAAFDLGRRVEQVHVTPREPDAALGQRDRATRKKGASKSNEKKRANAKAMDEQIIDLFKQYHTPGMQMKALYSIISQRAACSERKAQGVISKFKKLRFRAKC